MKRFFQNAHVRTMMIVLIVTLMVAVIMNDLGVFQIHDDIQLLFVVFVMILITVIYATRDSEA